MYLTTEGKTDRIERRNTQLKNSNCSLQNPTFNNEWKTRQKIKKEREDTNNTISQTDLTDYTEHFSQRQQNIHSSEVHIKHPGQTIC